MSDSPNRKAESRPPADEPRLERFLQAFDTYLRETTALCLAAAGDGAQRELMESTTRSLIAQSAKLTAYTRQQAQGLPPAKQARLNEFMDVAAGEEMAQETINTAKLALGAQERGGFISSLIRWVAQHLRELKKILEQVLDFIFGPIGMAMPQWLHKILLILDQLFHLVLSLLGEVFGIDFGMSARALANDEVDYLRQAAALRQLQGVAPATASAGSAGPSGPESTAGTRSSGPSRSPGRCRATAWGCRGRATASAAGRRRRPWSGGSTCGPDPPRPPATARRPVRSVAGGAAPGRECRPGSGRCLRRRATGTTRTRTTRGGAAAPGRRGPAPHAATGHAAPVPRRGR